MKDKSPSVMAMSGTTAEPQASSREDLLEEPAVVPPPPKVTQSSAQSDALSALANLGYNPGDAAAAVAQAGGENPEAETAELIRAALKLLAPKN